MTTNALPIFAITVLILSDVKLFFSGFTITREDRRDDYGELRLQTLGVWDGIVVFVVHLDKNGVDHIISIRKAEKHEERLYWKHIAI